MNGRAARFLVRSLAVFLAAVTIGPSARAGDFIAGLAAYDAGDFETVWAEWMPLAEAGDAEAQAAIAGLYLSGEGTRRWPKEAARWFHLAAGQGDPVAQLNLGALYRDGLGVKQDLVQAYMWFDLAAAQGRHWAARQRDQVVNRLSATELRKARAAVRKWRSSHTRPGSD